MIDDKSSVQSGINSNTSWIDNSFAGIGGIDRFSKFKRANNNSSTNLIIKPIIKNNTKK